jgi:hypothetical protein
LRHSIACGVCGGGDETGLLRDDVPGEERTPARGLGA